MTSKTRSQVAPQQQPARTVAVRAHLASLAAAAGFAAVVLAAWLAWQLHIADLTALAAAQAENTRLSGLNAALLEQKAQADAAATRAEIARLTERMRQADDHSYLDLDHIGTDDGGGTAGEPSDVQVARAIAAGPAHVTSTARIVGTDAYGKRTVLREGGNGFTCQPGDPNIAGRPASCANEAALQWSADLAAHQARPTNTEPGIVYMLASATQPRFSASSGEIRGPNTNPAETGSPKAGSPKTGSPISIGPHWMILWPFDPKATGLSETPKATGAYIMGAGTPYAHLHVIGQPVGTPMEHLDIRLDDGGPQIESPDVQMARAIAAGPREITNAARIMGINAQGKMTVLREGSNGFICQPGNPKIVAQPASCSSTTSKPRITYMLAGATQRSISDPADKTSPPLAVGPHWMIMMPFDPKTTGLPVTYSDTGAYIMWAGTRSAHLHIMGTP